ncbi:MAG: hypothetical protein QF521_05325 [Alphaproteobacteria bacterium]|nr:hypothetical protein [Alphaproteobacteria bacterium]
MSVQCEETNDQSSDAAPRSAAEIHYFQIQSEPEASALSRVLELFALRDMIPGEVTCKHMHDGDAGRGGSLHIHIAIADMPPHQAANIAARMRNIIPVTRVVLEPAEV